MIAVHAGPRPFEDVAVLTAIRTAIKGLQALSFRYEGGSTPGRGREEGQLQRAQQGRHADVRLRRQ